MTSYEENQKRDKEKKDDGNLIGGIALVVLGVFFAVDQYIDIDFRDIWPYLLIIIGIVLIWKSRR